MRIANTKFARVVAVRDSGPCGAEEGATGDDNAAVWLDDWTTTVPLPDLSDDLTALGLLALVRERWGDPGMYVRPRGSKARPDWAVCAGVGGTPQASGESEVEALVVALEVAP
jgi:hypothetical protein